MQHEPNSAARVITLWSIQTWDGGDRHNHAFYVTSEEAAKGYLEGNTYDRYEKVELVTYISAGDARAGARECERKRALAKLSPSERRALGFE